MKAWKNIGEHCIHCDRPLEAVPINKSRCRYRHADDKTEVCEFVPYPFADGPWVVERWKKLK